MYLLYAGFAGNFQGAFQGISCQHGSFDMEAFQIGNCSGRFRLDGIGNHQVSGQNSPDCKKDFGSIYSLCAFGQIHMEFFHQLPVACQNLSGGQCGLNSVACQFFQGNSLFRQEVFFTGGSSNAYTDGVGGMLLQAGAELQHFFFRIVLERDDLLHHEISFCDGAGFIHNNRGNMVQSFNSHTAFE